MIFLNLFISTEYIFLRLFYSNHRSDDFNLSRCAEGNFSFMIFLVAASQWIRHLIFMSLTTARVPCWRSANRFIEFSFGWCKKNHKTNTPPVHHKISDYYQRIFYGHLKISVVSFPILWLLWSVSVRWRYRKKVLF